MMEMERAWPPFGLSMSHEDLLLREATDDDVLALAQIVEDGIVESGQEHYMPNLLLDRPNTEQARFAKFLQYHWKRRAETSADRWALVFAIVVDGRVVGSQSLHTESYPVLRDVHTGSFLSPLAQGRGIGSRMRAMVLELCFGHLGALTAASGYVTGNDRSRKVSARLGYEPDGLELFDVGGRRISSNRVRISRDRWLARRPTGLDSMATTGVDEFRAFVGID
jgi:RimJ/RimL family protein N-acetyltransferase